MKKGLLKKYAELFVFGVRLCDLTVILASGLASHYVRFGIVAVDESYQLAIVVVALVALLVFPLFGLYQPWRGISLWTELKTVVSAWITVVAFCMILTYLTKTGFLYSRLWFGFWIVSATIMLSFVRIGLRVALRKLREKGYNKRRIVIVGAGELGRNVAKRLENEYWAGMEIVGFFDDGAGSKCPGKQTLRILGTLDEVGKYIQEENYSENGNGFGKRTVIDQVWLALPLNQEQEIRSVLAGLSRAPVTIKFVPDVFSYNLLSHSFEEVAGIPVVNLSGTSTVEAGRMIKDLEDRMVAVLVLTVASPLLAAIAIGVKMSSPGPVLYKQVRMTWGGRPFEMYKFRTMPLNAERESGPVWAQPDEGRATRFGSFLRRTSLDELPQFVNVLKGEMSVVGPRPERPYFVEKFKDRIPKYMQKHVVKGGITGWAQVNGWRGQTSIRKRIEYDLYYIENWSLGFDLKILFLTFLKGFYSKNAY